MFLSHCSHYSALSPLHAVVCDHERVDPSHVTSDINSYRALCLAFQGQDATGSLIKSESSVKNQCDWPYLHTQFLKGALRRWKGFFFFKLGHQHSEKNVSVNQCIPARAKGRKGIFCPNRRKKKTLQLPECTAFAAFQ